MSGDAEWLASFGVDLVGQTYELDLTGASAPDA
jgi:hypothetical protein